MKYYSTQHYDRVQRLKARDQVRGAKQWVAGLFVAFVVLTVFIVVSAFVAV